MTVGSSRNFLLFFQINAHVGRNRIDQLQRIVHVQGGRDQIAGEVRHEVGHAAELIDHVAHQGFDFQRFFQQFGIVGDARPQKWLGGDVLINANAGKPLHQQPHCAIRGAERPMHLCQRPDFVNVVGFGLFEIRVFGGEETHHAIRIGNVIDEFERTRLADGQGHGRIREDNQTPQRQNRQVVRAFH